MVPPDNLLSHLRAGPLWLPPGQKGDEMATRHLPHLVREAELLLTGLLVEHGRGVRIDALYIDWLLRRCQRSL